MKPKTRLLIRLSYEDGSMKSFGYDAWYMPHKTLEGLLKSVEDDFATIHEHVNVHLFYDTRDIELGRVENWQTLRAAIAEFMGSF